MTQCRNKLMNAGLPYPKSSCALCGSAFSVNRVCSTGTEPNPPPNSRLKPEHYIPTRTESTNVEKYAVIYSETIHHEGDERSRTNPGHGYPAYTETVETLKTFENEAALKAWIEINNRGYGSKSFKAIKYVELKVSTEVVISLS